MRTPIADFVESLGTMTSDDICRSLTALEARAARPDDDVAWWEASVAVERALRRSGLRRDGAAAARAAFDAVIASAAACALPIDDRTRTLARSAAEAARALTADVPLVGEGYLLRGWQATPPGIRTEAA